jgi:hypothetical protein
MSGSYELPPTAGSHFRARLFHPRWDIIESALGRPVPGRAAGSLCRPGHAGVEDEENAVEDPAMIVVGPPRAALRWERRGRESPVLHRRAGAPADTA